MTKQIEFISKDDEQEIVEAIRDAEKNTSGEIRVHIERTCELDLKDRAKKVFQKLKMHHTKLENGVLIYLAVEDRKFYVLGDRGINQKVPDDFWESTKELMLSHFKKEEFKQGLIEGILKAGQQLKSHFPHQSDDINELSDEISRS